MSDAPELRTFAVDLAAYEAFDARRLRKHFARAFGLLVAIECAFAILTFRAQWRVWLQPDVVPLAMLFAFLAAVAIRPTMDRKRREQAASLRLTMTADAIRRVALGEPSLTITRVETRRILEWADGIAIHGDDAILFVPRELRDFSEVARRLSNWRPFESEGRRVRRDPLAYALAIDLDAALLLATGITHDPRLATHATIEHLGGWLVAAVIMVQAAPQRFWIDVRNCALAAVLLLLPALGLRLLLSRLIPEHFH
jgi:hypothetical protein